MKESNLQMARKFLSRQSEDTVLFALVQRLKNSNLDEMDRKAELNKFFKKNYSASMSSDLIDGIVTWMNE